MQIENERELHTDHFAPDRKMSSLNSQRTLNHLQRHPTLIPSAQFGPLDSSIISSEELSSFEGRVGAANLFLPDHETRRDRFFATV